MKALVDTGATYSCVSLSLVNKLRLRKFIKRPDNGRKLFTADGNSLNVLGVLEMSIDINELRIPFPFYVIRNLHHDMLLGLDLLTNTQAQIDLSNNVVSFYNGLIDINLNNCADVLLKTVNAVYIPARSEALIPVKVPQFYKPRLSLVEPATTLSLKRLALAKALVFPSQSRTVCRVLNPTDRPVHLRRRSLIATIKAVSEDDVCEEAIDERQESMESDNDVNLTLNERLTVLAEKEINLKRHDMTDEQFDTLSKLLYTNLDLFATSTKDLIGTDVVKHDIDTGDSPPIRKRPYRHSPEMSREMQKKVQELLEAGVIEETTSPWNSPCLLIKKSGGQEYRFVSDMRALNKVTRPVHWPLPTITDVLDTVADVNPRWFTNADFKSAYFQIQLTDDAKPKTAFTVAGRNYQYTRMVMGLCNSAQCWQRLLTSVLGDMVFSSAIVYLDDILVLSRTFEQHCTHLKTMFDKFRRANLRLNGKKCNFAASKVTYLGHVLSKDGISADPAKTAVIREWPRPKSTKNARSFLGVCNYYRRFISGFSTRSAPLRELTVKDRKFEWTDRQEKAFNDLKKALVEPPILCYPRFDLPLYLETDACIDGIGYILGNIDENGKKRVISYGGRGLRPNEKKWTVTELECLALLTAIKENHVYLASRQFQVYTDHVSLKYLHSLKVSSNNRLARWAIALQPYTFTVNYKEGKKLTAADGLSRRGYPSPPTELDDDDDLADDSFLACIDTDIFCTETERKQKIRRTDDRRAWTAINFVFAVDDGRSVEADNQTRDNSTDSTDSADEEPSITDFTAGYDLPPLQRECTDFAHTIRYLTDGSLPDDDKLARRIVLEADHYALIDGTLYHLYTPRSKGHDRIMPVVRQLCVPRTLRPTLLRAYHDDLSHAGHTRLYQTLKLKYWYPEMYTHTLKYVNSCDVCQRTKIPTRSKKAPLKTLPVVGPFQRIHLDHIGPLKPTKEGYRHILVVVDSLSAWPEAFPCFTTTAEEVANILYKEFITRYGVFDQLVTDQAKSFRNNLIQQLCKLLKIRHVFSSPHHAQANGAVERFNQTLSKSLRLICDKQDAWSDYIPAVLMSYRATVATSTSLSPYRILFGKEMKTGLDLSMLSELERSPDVERYVAELIPRLKVTEEISRQNLADANFKSKSYYDKKTADESLPIGSYVLLHDPTNRKGECRKLKRRFTGPYLILDRTDDGLNYKLRDCESGKERKALVHFNRLKRYNTERDELLEPQSREEEIQGDPPEPDDDWYTIKKVIARKLIKGKEHFRVVWEDGSRQWVPAEDVTDFAKSEYFVNRQQKRRRRRRA